MQKINGKLAAALAALGLALGLAACGGGSGTSSQSSTGAVSLNVTDAATAAYSHVYVTITGASFHTTTTAGFSDYSSAKLSGWRIVRLANPVTVDLAALSNGTMFADANGNPLFTNITLPAGATYRQIRIFLASTEDPLTDSATAKGLSYNNEVQLAGDSTHYPLRVPCPNEGIRLIPETPVTVTDGSSSNLAVDFNLNNDIVEVTRNGSTEFILKARLGFFDMDGVGAATGKISFGNLSTSRFVIKAEQYDPNVSTTHRVVRRFTSIKSDGTFNLYPLPIFGNNTTATYDILVRGRNVQTAIVTGVKVHKGTTLATGANLGTLPMTAGTEFTFNFSKAVHPTGAWANFYQTISSGSNPAIPYEVRYQHLNPYTGEFAQPGIALSAAPINVAAYAPGVSTVSFTPDSSGSNGNFSLILNAAGQYTEGAMYSLTGTAGPTVTVDPTSSAFASYLPQIQAGSTGSSLSVLFNMGLFGTGMGPGMGRSHMPFSTYPDQGQLFVTHGGMIVDSMGTLQTGSAGATAISAALQGSSTTSVTFGTVPYDTANGTVYGLYALGWGNGTLAAGKTSVRLGSGTSTSKTIRIY